MALISVVIPFFNTEKYIEKCLKSLIKQTLKDIEIICVNDGSTDNSMVIVKQLAEKDSRIKIINQENKLQGIARNVGMEIATGEYIGFVDSDDWVDLEYFEKLYNAAKKYNSDIALATNIRTGHGKTKKRLHIDVEQFVTTLQAKIDVSNQSKNPCPTNKIYRRQMLIDNNIIWPEGVYCEDKLFTIKAVYYANGIVTVPNCHYYYYRNPNSTVCAKKNKKDKKHIEDKINAERSVLNFIKEHNMQIRDKEFWAVKKDYKKFGISWYQIKESLYTEKHLLFALLPLIERNCVNE